MNRLLIVTVTVGNATILAFPNVQTSVLANCAGNEAKDGIQHFLR